MERGGNPHPDEAQPPTIEEGLDAWYDGMGEQPPPQPDSVFDYWTMAIEARRRQIVEWDNLTDEEKAEKIWENRGMMGA